MKTTPVQTTNYQKFQTGNPVVRRLIDNFYRTITARVAELAPSSLLDAGCGEGETLERLGDLLPERTSGVDLREESIGFARRRIPQVELSVQDVRQLSFPDDAFDLVLCLEVLEHLDEPATALLELLRVTKKDLVLSVPHEPWFRLGSLLRGKYLRSFGNHPEHVQHWNPDSIRQFIEPHADVLSVETAFPWIIAHVTKREME